MCNPITKEFREELYGSILDLYAEMEQTGKAEIVKEAEGAQEPNFTVKVTPVSYTHLKKYGPITGQGSQRAFRDDADYPLLCSLEVVDEDGRVEKADMFYKQTIRPKTMPARVETAVEALNISVNEFGGVNIPYMLMIYEPALQQTLENLLKGVTLPDDEKAELKRSIFMEELAGLIFLDPTEYNENNLCMGCLLYTSRCV